MLSRRNLSYPSRRPNPNPCLIKRLQPLCSLSPAPVLCFQQPAASFPKTPGVGVSPSGPAGSSALTILLGIPDSLSIFFRINTCKSVSKQRALTPFRINTYEKHSGGGRDSPASSPESSRVARCAALAVEETPAGDPGKRGGACLRPRWTLCVHRGRCFLSPATHTEPPAGFLAGLQVAVMPTRNSCSYGAPAARLLTNSTVRLPHNSTGGARNVSALRPPARHPPGPPRTRWRLRSKTPTAAHRSQRNSCRRSAPS